MMDKKYFLERGMRAAALYQKNYDLLLKMESAENLSHRLAEISARPRDKTFYRDLLAFARDNRPKPTLWENIRF